MFLFPVVKFWTYSPLQFVCVLLWNLSEITRVPLPFAEKVFGVIIKSKPQKVV